LSLFDREAGTSTRMRGMSILDLLDAALSTDLTDGEVHRVRAILRRDDHRHMPVERPWESGVPELRSAKDTGKRSEVDELEDRVALLEMTVKLLVEALAAKGVLDGAVLTSRIRALEQEVARLRQEDDAYVVCASCNQRVARAGAVQRATGILCEPCHRGARRPDAPEMQKVEVEGSTYRDATRSVDVEVTRPCVGCGVQLKKAEAYLSSRGSVCKRCMAEQGDEE